MRRSDTRWVFVFVMAIGLIALVRSHQYYGTLIRGSDAFYYHAFAHSLVFDWDTDITNNIELGPNPVYMDPEGDRTWSRVPRNARGSFRMKHPVGVSLIAAPFLALGHGARRILGVVGVEVEGAPGYSALELYAASAGLLVVVAIGAALVYRFAAEEYGRWPAAIGLSGCLFGTSLFHYAAVQTYWAHGASFGVLVMLLGASRPLWQDGPVNRALVLLAAAGGAIFLIRPQQALVGLFLVPVLLRTVRTRSVRDWAYGAAAGLLVCLAAVGLQVWLNYTQFDTWTLSAYQASGEQFLRGGDARVEPFYSHISSVLFMPSRGLLIFSPIVAVAALGYVLHARAVPGYLWPAVANSVAQVIVIAAWSPHQGESFGSRMWTGTSLVVVFGLAVLFRYASSRWRWVLAVATLGSVLVTTYRLALYMGLVG